MLAVLPLEALAQNSFTGPAQGTTQGTVQGAGQASGQVTGQGATQGQGGANAAGASQGGGQDESLPVIESPKKPENPISRLEIVSLGSFPILLFYTGFVFDLQRFVANNFDTAYAPWPIQSSYSAQLTDSERLTRIGVALGGCLIVGCVDAYLHQVKLKKAKRLREAASSLSSSDGAATGSGP
jgi:hypothetical protein